MSRETNYWFPAKRYGWGWGVPTRWQGWVVLGVFLVLVILGSVLISPATSSGNFSIYLAVISAALIGVCFLKGEPPKWRWGDR